jgi:hypothetical protein
MNRAHPDFWTAYRALPAVIRAQADKSFELLKADPRHPSLRLKKIGDYWSARVGKGHRALAIEINEGLLWVWIGSHNDYERLIGR